MPWLWIETFFRAEVNIMPCTEFRSIHLTIIICTPKKWMVWDSKWSICWGNNIVYYNIDELTLIDWIDYPNFDPILCVMRKSTWSPRAPELIDAIGTAHLNVWARSAQSAKAANDAAVTSVLFHFQYHCSLLLRGDAPCCSLAMPCTFC